MNIQVAAFLETLPMMAQGMLGIFAVMIVIALIVMTLNRLH